MNRIVRAMRLGLEVLPLLEQTVRDARATGGGWPAVRKAFADHIMRGDLDRAMRLASGSSKLVEDYVEGGGQGT